VRSRFIPATLQVSDNINPIKFLGGKNMSEIFDKISIALQEGETEGVREFTEKALADGISAKDILEKGLLPGMDIIAVKFTNNEVFVPEVLMAARAMNAGSALLKPHLVESGTQAIGKAVIGTVKGDLHDIGKNLVRMMLEGKGIEVIDLGVDVPPEKFIEVCKAENADIIAMSALLTTTMGEMKNIIEAIDAADLKNVTVMVGGAPVTESFSKKIGADIFTADAASAAGAAKKAILSKQK
jgi:5-methyltetrahydrofolate--homocysteine methyltransferase